MWSFIGLIIIGVLIKFFYDWGQQKEKVAQEGGMERKYQVLILHLMSIIEDAIIVHKGTDTIIIGTSSSQQLGFYITQAFSKVIVQWKAKMVDGSDQSLKWEFDQYGDQTQMYEKVLQDCMLYQQRFLQNIGVDFSEINEDSADGLAILKIAKEAAAKLENDYKILTSKGRFEAIIYNSLIMLCWHQEDNPSTHHKTQQVFIEHLMIQSKKYNLGIPNSELGEFINSSLDFYTSCLDDTFELANFNSGAAVRKGFAGGSDTLELVKFNSKFNSNYYLRMYCRFYDKNSLGNKNLNPADININDVLMFSMNLPLMLNYTCNTYRRVV